MSDLKHRNLEALRHSKRETERYIERLKQKINGQETRLQWVNRYIRQREAEGKMNIDQQRAAFEALFPMPENITWAGDGYAVTAYGDWKAINYCHKWDGYQAALASPEVQALREDAEQTKQTCKLGIYGKAYDLPSTHRAYTFDHQPGNVEASRLGGVVRSTEKRPDAIDTGLGLLKNLQAAGFGVFEVATIDAAMEKQK